MSADTISEQTQEQSIVTKLWFWSAAIVLAIVVGGGWIIYSRVAGSEATAGNGAAPLEAAPIAGHPAPNFQLKTLDGEVINLADYKGKPVLVNFWATWCGPCRAEMPEFQEAAIDNADRLVVIGVNNTASDTPELVGDFVAELGITFPIVLDVDGSTTETYRVLGLPMTVFIDSDGIVNEVFTGPINKAYIEAKIPEL